MSHSGKSGSEKKCRAEVKVMIKNHNLETLKPIIMYFQRGSQLGDHMVSPITRPTPRTWPLEGLKILSLQILVEKYANYQSFQSLIGIKHFN